MPAQVPIAFEREGVTLALDRILPLKSLSESIRSSQRYLRIKASMQEVGIIEPPIVFPQRVGKDVYMLLDGHLRLDIAKSLKLESLFCLIATDDEAFTYNHKVNQLQPIQEHFMILRAIKSGVSEERIAKTLNVNVDTIKQKRDLLTGICPEAVELLRDRQASAGALRETKRVKPMRQIEMAEVMVASNNYTAAYAKCLVLASSPDQLLEPSQQTTPRGMEDHDVARLQKEINSMEHEFTLVQEEYGRDMLNLVVVVGYLRSLLNNAAVVRFLSQAEPTILAEFQKIMDQAEMRATG
jgi:ParB-like chromosome segregation protein Spo0J